MTAVTSVHDDTNREYDADSLIVATDYMFDSEEGTLRLEGDLIFLRSKQNVRVVYTAGFSATPDDIRLAIFDWVGARLQKAQKRWHGLASDTVGDATVAYLNEDIPKQVKKIIAKYENIGRQQINR